MLQMFIFKKSKPKQNNMLINIRVAFLSMACLLYLHKAVAQDEIRKLPPNINRPSIDLYSPFISGDGQTIIFLTNYTDDGNLSMRWATKRSVSTWNDELEVTKLINRPTLNYWGGYSLSFDGDLMIFTSRKSGLGGFDLWYSHRRGNDWEAPSNFGSPVNSAEDEGAATLSPDGEYMYFMRCDKITEYQGASGCRLMVAKRTYNGWETPQELPANINTGNSQTPRILADGETLIFASDQMGGKGGLDLFMTKKEGSSWTDPVPMDFLNTEKDDQFVSIPAKGRYVYADRKGDRDNELVQILIPEEFQPKKVMRVRGTIVDDATGDPLDANLTVFNIGDRDRLWNEKVGNKGEFAIVLKEGAAYDVSVDMDDPAYMFYSKVYDLSEEVGARDKENLNIRLAPIQAGKSYPTEITFQEHSAVLSDNATFELRRIADMLRKHPDMKIEISVSQNNYMEDSVQSDPDLTEVDIDSIFTQVERLVVSDSVSSLETDSLLHAEEAYSEEEYGGDTTQNANVTAAIDSVQEQQPEHELVEQLEIRTTYHNDRTEQQAASIQSYIAGRGIGADRVLLTTSHNSADTDPSGESEPDIVVEMKVLQL